MKQGTKAAEALQKGREAFGAREWAEAYARLSAADEGSPLEIGDLELFASAAYLIGKDQISNDIWVRAHNECLRLNDVPRAARCTFWLVNDLLMTGDVARAGGWLTRTQRLLDDGDHDCPERGLILVMQARLHVIRRDTSSAYDAACQAMQISDRFDDPELKAFGRLILGQTKVRRKEAAEATALFDELMVAATVGEVSPVAVGVLYCAVIDSCHNIFDIKRAREWTAALSQWCESQPELVPFRGQCIVHRAEILRLSGAWSQALEEAEHACSWFLQLANAIDASTGVGNLPPVKYPVGAAFYELAEIHRVRGDFANAEKAYRQASRYGQSPEPGLPLLRMAQGRLKAAETSIRRVLGQRQNPFMRAAVLAASVDIMIAKRDLTTARIAAEELVAIAADAGPPFLRALSAQSMGAVLLAEGDPRLALNLLRTAWMVWQEIEAPYDAARVRVLLGLACRDLGDADAAEMEFDAARRVFQRLTAVPDVDRVNTLMESAAGHGAQVLTPRELEVIGLVTTGKTNRDIAQELSISERTVDRHVSNILLKLGLSSRAAATAYAYEHGLV